MPRAAQSEGIAAAKDQIVVRSQEEITKQLQVITREDI